MSREVRTSNSATSNERRAMEVVEVVVVEAEAEAENDNTHYPVSPTVNTVLV